MKMGRNDPCHCGSSQKYKKCCAAKDDAARAAEVAAQAAERAAEAASDPEASALANAKPSVKRDKMRPMPGNAPLKPHKGAPPPAPAMVRKHAV